MLGPLCDRKSLVVLGMNSGTSADGLDLAAMKITRRSPARFLAGLSVPHPESIRRLVLRTADTPTCSINDAILLDNMLGEYIGEVAATYIKKLSRRGIPVDAIASHGQTIRHLPEPVELSGYRVRATMQVGSPALIATHTGRVVVADFRQGDIALGGEGAPITVTAMDKLFSHPTQTRLIVNVGGMSNYFLLPPSGAGDSIKAADCGPGNVLSDLLCRRLFDEPYDRNGHHAARGSVSHRLLSIIMASPFFSGTHRSTGREEFGELMVERIVTAGRRMKLLPDDLVATVMEVTAAAIAGAVTSLVSKGRRRGNIRLYLTGGGSHNRFLMTRLSGRLPGVPVTTVSDLGVD
ncbi:MAG: anhydro-N-acetylmuramic acid kinase, partial [candidate division Zixibacteria bacterium]|nr:anhydro-N-acetylmuramic acid kinase [candidate division Zixibacteria bacterium]